MVEIKIVGAHKQVLELSVEESVVAQTELKTRSGNGYDHFVLDRHDLRDGCDARLRQKPGSG